MNQKVVGLHEGIEVIEALKDRRAGSQGPSLDPVAASCRETRDKPRCAEKLDGLNGDAFTAGLSFIPLTDQRGELERDL